MILYSAICFDFPFATRLVLLFATFAAQAMKEAIELALETEEEDNLAKLVKAAMNNAGEYWQLVRISYQC